MIVCVAFPALLELLTGAYLGGIAAMGVALGVLLRSAGAARDWLVDARADGDDGRTGVVGVLSHRRAAVDPALDGLHAALDGAFALALMVMLVGYAVFQALRRGFADVL